ncbi:hypothetical protein [Arthrobacter sp. MYb221]
MQGMAPIEYRCHTLAT